MTYKFCALWRRYKSQSVNAIIASAIGTALIPTQGSCLPFVLIVVGLFLISKFERMELDQKKINLLIDFFVGLDVQIFITDIGNTLISIDEKNATTFEIHNGHITRKTDWLFWKKVL